MSKSIYEEALEIIDKNIFELPMGFAVLYEIRKRIEQAQKQSQKRVKLLKLYRKLDDCIVASAGHHVCRYTDDEKYARIRKQIKELENEINL